MERAKLLFGCYRRGDANDPDTYVAAVTMVLSRYSADVVRAVTDPVSGLPSRKSESGWTGMPDVADVKAACEAEAARVDRLERYAALPRTDFKRLPPPPAAPGAWANVFVPASSPQYERMVELSKTTDPRKWRYDADRPGIWVTINMLDQPRAMKPLAEALTLDDIAAKYATGWDTAPPATQPAEQGAEF